MKSIFRCEYALSAVLLDALAHSFSTYFVMRRLFQALATVFWGLRLL